MSENQNADADDANFDTEVLDFLERHCAALQIGEHLSPPEKLLSEHPELIELLQCVNLLESFAESQNSSCLGTVLLHTSSLSSSILHQLPRNFGSFCLEEELGRGGMGVVYKARHLTLQTYFALKMIRTCEFASDEEVRRFFQEARAASRLRHPGIVSVHDAGEQDGIPFLVMTYIDGQTLTKRLECREVDLNQGVADLIQVALAVEYLHQQGIVHRDLKPSNILTDRTGNTYVTDFGLAKVFGDEGERTVTGTILGTPAYMAPEQAWGKVNEVSPQSDLYSLGGILYEILTGHPPFHDEIPLDQILRLRDSEPKPPRKLKPGLPVAIEKICLRCLEKKPEHRYQTARELAEDLQRYLDGEPITLPSMGWWSILRRWARKEPALAVHLIALITIASIVQFTEWNTPGVRETHLSIMGILLLWACFSTIFQRLITNGWSYIRRTWIVTDAAMFTIAVANTTSPFESLVAGYALLIVASSLWYKPRLVAVTTISTVISYSVLLVLRGSPETPAHHPYLVIGILLVTGGVVISLVRRIHQLLTIRSRL